MNHADKRLLIELYADGELQGPELARAEETLESDPEAREYLAALEEMRALVQAPVTEAIESVDFGGLFSRVSDAIDATPERSLELDALVVAYADEENLRASDKARVLAYLETHPEAREAVGAIDEMRALVRAPIEEVTESVDFQALARRIDLAIDHELGNRAAEQVKLAQAEGARQPSVLERLAQWVGPQRSLLAAVAMSGLLVVVVTQDEPSGSLPDAYAVPAEVTWEPTTSKSGFQATFRPGDTRNHAAPVLWIAPEGSENWEKEPHTDPDAGGTSEISL